jgi:predicted AlkP superfamily pyrophosphatase or phosphodiesterase
MAVPTSQLITRLAATSAVSPAKSGICQTNSRRRRGHEVKTVLKRLLTGIAAAAAWAAAAHGAPVLMISIDGLRPADVLEAQQRGLKIPTLRSIAAQGAYATDVVNVIPTVTYPNHTTLITGVRPDVHGISNNVAFDPLKKNEDGWEWYAADIKTPTLWDVVHANGGVVASLGWPVSVGATSIDDNVPEYWRARTNDDLKLLRALSTPGLVAELEQASATPISAIGSDTSPDADEAKARFSVAMYKLKRPTLFTIHLSSLDHVQHQYGPSTPEAHAALERIDTDVSTILTAARKAEPSVVVVIVSDHGFAPVSKAVNLYRPFIDAGLITLGPSTHKPTSWEAEPWGGASAAVVLARPDDAALKAKVKALLDKLAADPAYGFDRVINEEEIKRRGIAGGATFYIDFKLGYEMGDNFDAMPVTPTLMRGSHGWFTDYPEMHSTFMIEGPGIEKRGSLGQIDMRDIAPTVAKVLNVDMPTAQGKALF